MFLTLNILQHRLAHLHTYFTVKKRHFDSVAKKLVSLTPELIASVATHLEREGAYADLTPSQRNALDL